MTRPKQESPGRVARRVEVRKPVELAALADELSVRLGRPVVLGGTLPQDTEAGLGLITVRDAETGEEIDKEIDEEAVAAVVKAHVPPVRVSPAAQLAKAAEGARTVAQLSAAIVAYARSLEV